MKRSATRPCGCSPAGPTRPSCPHLLAIAESTDGVRHQVLAIRGLVRLAGPQKDKPADVKMLAERWSLPNVRTRNGWYLGVLGGVATPASLAVVVPALDDPALVNEAGLAVVSIAEKMKAGSKDELRTAVRKVLKTTKNQQVRQTGGEGSEVVVEIGPELEAEEREKAS